MLKSNNPFEVPNEMRDLASRSVEQARKAFDSFIGAAEKATDSAEAAGAKLKGSVADASKRSIELAGDQVNSALDLAQKLVHAKSLEEVSQIQMAYFKAQSELIQAEFTAAAQNAQDVAKKMMKS